MSLNPSDILVSSEDLFMARRRTTVPLLAPEPTQDGMACLAQKRYLLGERIELLAVQGLLTIDAIVTGCVQEESQEGVRYRLNLRYQGLSEALHTLLNQELLASVVL